MLYDVRMMCIHVHNAFARMRICRKICRKIKYVEKSNMSPFSLCTVHYFIII